MASMAQIRVMKALGIKSDGNASEAIKAELKGRSVVGAVFANLTRDFNVDHFKKKKTGRYEYYTEKCPYCNATNDISGDTFYLNFSFNENGFHCLSCKNGGGLMKLSAKMREGGEMIRKGDVIQSSLPGFDSEVKARAASKRQPHTRHPHTRHPMPVSAYYAKSMPYNELPQGDYNDVAAYFAEKGVTHQMLQLLVLPHMDAVGVRYAYRRAHYNGACNVVSILFPLVKSGMVTSMKRRLMRVVEGGALRWNFDVWSKEDYLWGFSQWGFKDEGFVDVVIENPADAAVLNALALRQMAPVRFFARSHHTFDIVAACEGMPFRNSTIVIAYDNDANGEETGIRDARRLHNAGYLVKRISFKRYAARDGMIDVLAKNGQLDDLWAVFQRFQPDLGEEW